MSRSHTSAVHSYYSIVDNGNEKVYRRCKAAFCNKSYSLNSGNGTLVAHLRAQHPICYQEYRDSILTCNGGSIVSASSSNDMETNSFTQSLINTSILHSLLDEIRASNSSLPSTHPLFHSFQPLLSCIGK